MPGYVIHLAATEEYLKKQDKNRKENYKNFIEGVIFPDSVSEKSLTHYGKNSSSVNLVTFLNNNSIEESFNRGYFLHLLTDYLFYNKYIEYFSNDIYNDYDILNKSLIEKYNVKLPKKVKNQVFFKENLDLKILSLELVDNLILEVSSKNLDMLKNEIEKDPIKWTKIRKLKKFDS